MLESAEYVSKLLSIDCVYLQEEESQFTQLIQPPPSYVCPLSSCHTVQLFSSCLMVWTNGGTQLMVFIAYA